ncbi:MAG: glycosyltransferase [Nanoarchaeota archaeon]|nr:glycosyltransferase [Nanoarchaeota archaeon]
MKKQKIALFHPWIKSRGGAEGVVLKLAKDLNAQVHLYTWIYDKEKTFPEFKKLKIKVLSPKFFKKLSRTHFLRGIFLFLSFFSKIHLERYDKFLISTSGVGEFISFRNYKKGETYAYVHTPLREANEKIMEWNLENRHKTFLSRVFYLSAVKVYRFFEKMAWKRIDHIIFNSELSKQRAKEHNLIGNKENYVIYPPVEIPKKSLIKKGNYFLYVSRINPPKRQKELIEAFNNFSKVHPEFRLILVGAADNEKYYNEIVRGIKGKNIEIRSNLSNEELGELYSGSLAGVFVGYQEDFGIVPLEVIGRGKPLIAVDEGGFVDLIKDNPLFHKIKEKHSRKEMVREIGKELENFINKKYPKSKKKIKLNDFIKEIEGVLRA